MLLAEHGEFLEVLPHGLLDRARLRFTFHTPQEHRRINGLGEQFRVLRNHAHELGKRRDGHGNDLSRRSGGGEREAAREDRGTLTSRAATLKRDGRLTSRQRGRSWRR